MTVAQHHPEPDDVTPGNAPPCPTDCPERHHCMTCGYPLCPVHEPAACRPCAVGGYHHDDDCWLFCYECDAAAWQDELAERADRIWKDER